MKKFRTLITILALTLFLSGLQSCYVEQDTGRHRWWFHRHDMDRDHDRDHNHNHNHDRGSIILFDRVRHERA